MPEHSFRLIKKHFINLDKLRFLILGVSYLKNIGDTRNSPSKYIYDRLTSMGAFVSYFDPYIPKWNETSLQSLDINELFQNNFDAILIGAPHDVFFKEKYVEKIIEKKKSIFILDPFSSINKKIIKDKKNHIIKFIGRGDV